MRRAARAQQCTVPRSASCPSPHEESSESLLHLIMLDDLVTEWATTSALFND